MEPTAVYCWYLWKRNPTDYAFRFFHRDDLPQCGFISVYAVDEATADSLVANRDFSGFKGVVYSPTLWIDCDTEEASSLVEAGLREEGLCFEKWTTGNRGAHYGVAREAAPSPLLPSLDKAWVKARFPAADLSLYTHLHLFRAPGEKHQKTGARKMLLYIVDGEVLKYGREERKPSFRNSANMRGSARGDRELGSLLADELVMAFSTPQENGGRNRALSAVAYRMAERGEDKAFTRRWLDHVNLLFAEPKEPHELDKIVYYAYQRRGDR